MTLRKPDFTESINFGLITIVSIIVSMVLIGFVAALYSDGEAILVAARTLTYPLAPFIVLMLIGFAVFNSSRRTTSATLMFNFCSIVLAVGIVSILLIGVATHDDVLPMWGEALTRSFILSMVVLAVFGVVAFKKHAPADANSASASHHPKSGREI